MSAPRHVLPQADARRKAAPMCRGLLDYFPAALFAVAEHSYRSDRKHNPETPEGSDPHWAREKSTDHADCCVRHLAERGSDPAYHLRAHAWRALALLQEYCEAHEGAAPGLASVFPDVASTGELPGSGNSPKAGDYVGIPLSIARQAAMDVRGEDVAARAAQHAETCVCHPNWDSSVAAQAGYRRLCTCGLTTLREALDDRLSQKADLHDTTCPSRTGGYAPCTCRRRAPFSRSRA